MSELEVELVIDKHTLEHLMERDKLNLFLKFWISKKNTKAVVNRRAWAEYISNWEGRLKDNSPEIKDPFFASIRGIVTPYRNKYKEECGESDEELPDDSIEEEPLKDPIDENVRIVNRHYATIKYFITDMPSVYEKKEVKINTERILTLKGFYADVEVQEPNLLEVFCKEYELPK